MNSKVIITLYSLIFLVILMHGCIPAPKQLNISPTITTTVTTISDRITTTTLTTTSTSISIITTIITTTSTPSTSSTTIPAIVKKITIKDINLSGDIRSDVDVILTPNKKIAIIPTRMVNGRGYLDIIDIVSQKLTRGVILSGDIRSGVDPLVVNGGKIVLMPVRNPLNAQGIVDIIDISSTGTRKSVLLAGDLQYDVDIAITPDGKTALIPSRIATLYRGFLDQIDISTGMVVRRYNLKNDLQSGVDLMITSDGKTALMATMHRTAGSTVDIIDLQNKVIFKTMGVPGGLQYDVDPLLVENNNIFLVPTTDATRGYGYLNIIDYSVGKVLYRINLSGTLQESVDARLSNDKKTAIVPSHKGTQGYLDIVDITRGSVVKSVKLSGDLCEDVDVLLMFGENTALIPSHKGTRGYITILKKIPSNLALMPVTLSEQGYLDIIEVGLGKTILKVKLPGDIHQGVDSLASNLAPLTPHVDEDMVIEKEYFITTTTTTATTTTTTTIPIPPTVSTTTTITTTSLSTTTSTSTTTTSGMVITPRCGDGYLSHPWTPGGGLEECDPNTGPYNNWSGAREYKCPSPLQCVNCKCVGCGDGRLQEGEECDPFNIMIYINGNPLWKGQKYECDPPAVCIDCKCILPDGDGDGITDGEDNCPDNYNPEQEDTDEDGIGDKCDKCPNDPYNDKDRDGICGNKDNCPDNYNPEQSDLDGDGIGDHCDPEPVDCDAYCGNDAGNGGYVSKGFNVPDSQTCHDQYMIPECETQNCYLTCCYSYFHKWSWNNGLNSFSCCCVKVFRFHCYDCPGENPQCPDKSLCDAEEPFMKDGDVKDWSP